MARVTGPDDALPGVYGPRLCPRVAVRKVAQRCLAFSAPIGLRPLLLHIEFRFPAILPKSLLKDFGIQDEMVDCEQRLGEGSSVCHRATKGEKPPQPAQCGYRGR